jgi:hypothetical protein
MHLGSAPRIPCPLRRLVPALFPAADAGCAILGYPCRRKTCCTIYSGIHTPALCYQLLSSPLCAFLGFLLLRLYVRMSTKPSKCGDLHGRRSFEAARNDAALASVPSCRSTQTPTVPFDVYLPCRSGTLRRVSSACILAVRQLSFAFVKSMIPAWSDNTDC